VPGHLLLKNCVEDEPARPAIERALKDDSLLWLDLADTSPDTLALLRDVFKIHPLAVRTPSSASSSTCASWSPRSGTWWPRC
jgi:Mg2+ and Co2+ transporter CorA